MPRGGARPGSGRKPSSGMIAKLATQARIRAASLIGTSDDPLELGLQLAKSEHVPIAIRAQLILGLVRVVHPVLVTQNVNTLSVHAHLSGDVLAAKTALALEQRRGGAEPVEVEGEAETETPEGLADLELERRRSEARLG